MKLTVAGDFADSLSYLASQRVTRLTTLGLAEVEWLAVESDRQRPMSGQMLDEATARNARGLSLPEEDAPAAGIKVPNSRAATSAYAESVSDGVAAELRQALFGALWVDQRRLDDPDVIRSIVGEVLTPKPSEGIEARIRANQPLVPLGDPDVFAISRRLGFIVSMGRGPLTLVGQRRIDAWAARWHQHGAPRLPLLIVDTGEWRCGEDALGWLAGLLRGEAAPVQARWGDVPTARHDERTAVSI